MCNIVKNTLFIGLNQNLIPLYDSNMGIVTITKWSQNLILTTKTVKNVSLGVFGPKDAINLPCFWHNFPLSRNFTLVEQIFIAFSDVI